MATATPLEAIRSLLAASADGEAVEKLQEPLYLRSGLKLSCRTIEEVLISNPDIFSQREGLWMIRKEI